MHWSVYYAAWRIKQVWSAGQGTRAPSCSDCSPGTPTSTSCTSPRVATSGRRSARSTRRSAPRTRASSTCRSTRARLAELDRRVPRAAARRVPADRRRSSSTRSRTSWTSAPTSGSRPTEYAQWYGDDHAGARADRPLRVRAARALPRHDRASTRTSRRPAATRPRRRSRSRRSSRRVSSSRRGSSSTRCPGVSGAGRGLKHDEPLLRGRRERQRLRPPHPPPHRGDGADAHPRRRRAGRRCCSRPTSCRWCAAIHATCHARPVVDGLTTASLLGDLPRLLRGGAVRERGRRAAADQGDDRRQRRAGHRALRRAHRTRSSRSA